MKEYVITCNNGIVCKGENGRIYWSWDFESMNMFGKDKPSTVARYLQEKYIHDSEIGAELIFTYADKNIQDLL